MLRLSLKLSLIRILFFCKGKRRSEGQGALILLSVHYQIMEQGLTKLPFTLSRLKYMQCKH